MRKESNFRFMLNVVAFTILLTWTVIIIWEKFLSAPFYSWVEARFPIDRRWVIEQRSEHFLISFAVDAVVVSLLLRLVARQQQGLRASEERYRTLFEHANDGIAMVEAANCELIEINERLEDMLGFRADELMGASFRDYILNTGDGLAADAFCYLLSANKPGQCELMLRTRSGFGLPVSISISRFGMGKQSNSSVVLIIRDLLERRRSEEQLKKLSSAVQQTADTKLCTNRIFSSRNSGCPPRQFRYRFCCYRPLDDAFGIGIPFTVTAYLRHHPDDSASRRILFRNIILPVPIPRR